MGETSLNDTATFYPCITDEMDPIQTSTGPSPEARQGQSHDVECSAELLRQAWASVSDSKSVDEMRSEMETLSRKFPEEGSIALHRVTSLAARVAELERDPDPPWLRTALGGRTPEHLSVQLLPTGIVLHISEETFTQIAPGARGTTLASKDLPDDVGGRIFLVPHPPRPGHDNTLRHEIIHTLEKWAPARSFSYVDARTAISKAESCEQVLNGVLSTPKSGIGSHLFDYTKKPAENVREHLADGSLFRSPFDRQSLHPWVQISQALRPEAPASDLIRLLCDEYPHRNQIWEFAPFGALFDKAKSADLFDRVSLFLAMAERSPREFDIIWSVIELGGEPLQQELTHEHINALQRIIPKLPPANKIVWSHQDVENWYLKALTRLCEKTMTRD